MMNLCFNATQPIAHYSDLWVTSVEILDQRQTTERLGFWTDIKK